MKTIFSFFMMLICLVSFTAGATTTKPEQKQKTEFVKTFNVETNAVSVDNDYQVVFVGTDVATKTEFKAKPFEVINITKHKVTNKDVGWRNSGLNYNALSKSNLPGINRIPIAENFSNTENVKIRSDR